MKHEGVSRRGLLGWLGALVGVAAVAPKLAKAELVEPKLRRIDTTTIDPDCNYATNVVVDPSLDLQVGDVVMLDGALVLDIPSEFSASRVPLFGVWDGKRVVTCGEVMANVKARA